MVPDGVAEKKRTMFSKFRRRGFPPLGKAEQPARTLIFFLPSPQGAKFADAEALEASGGFCNRFNVIFERVCLGKPLQNQIKLIFQPESIRKHRRSTRTMRFIGICWPRIDGNLPRGSRPGMGKRSGKIVIAAI